jgi:catechol 2,3-dioxygenase-like lactoylglutathione lyase family enzyme
MQITYAIRYVSDMERAVAFYRDQLGLTVKFSSPGWSEFATGATTLALHPATAENPAGSTELGFGVKDLQEFFETKSAAGVKFPLPPTKQDFGGVLARFEDSDGAVSSVASLP